MEEIYVTGVIIANGIPDSDGDVLNKKEIKQLLTKYTEHQTDTMHTYIRNNGVDIIENWINETPTVISGKDVPAGSWLCTAKVTNSNLIENILNGNLQAFSLGSLPNEAWSDKYWFINKNYKYSDFDIEDIQPLFISFVTQGANGYVFEVRDYEYYINKYNKNVGEKMTEKVEPIQEEEKISISGLAKIREMFSISKAETEPEIIVEEEPPVVEGGVANPVDLTEFKNEIRDGIVEGVLEGIKNGEEEEATINKADEEAPAMEEASIDEKFEAFKTELKTLISEAIVEGFNAVAQMQKEAIDKAEEEEEEAEEKPVEEEETIDKAEEEEEETATEEEEEEETIDKSGEETPKINKMDKATVKTDNVERTTSESNFYKLTGRNNLTGVKE